MIFEKDFSLVLNYLSKPVGLSILNLHFSLAITEKEKKKNQALSIELLYITAAAAASKSLQSCLTLCNPIEGSPPGSAIRWILQARTLEWVAISFPNA